MVRQFLPLNGLRAFEASARHLSFTRAAIELCVTQAAVSQQVKGLEKRLGVALFQRLPRGLKITAEGEALLPTVTSSFDQMATTLDRIEAGQVRELLFLGVVGTFAVGWLLPRLQAFQKRHPFIDVRVSTNNNRVDMAAEGLDFAIRFGQGSWHGTDAFRLFDAPLSPLCTPKLAETLKAPADLMEATLLRSYRADEWSSWFAAAGVTPAAQVNAGIVFDTSLGMMEAALQGLGVALAPPSMFSRHLASGAVVQPFPVTISLGSYWLTRLQSKPPTPAMQVFSDWLFDSIGTA
ncbi:LysR substrate-binding domain-containing protein [Rhizobium pusense]|jgi:LysR family transcriptional regulator of beta-lactamase|uniref:LysR family transcriptional regulator n=2 Tax=Hyphomicrobiales TaxID=356 RepID=A0AA44IZF4_9HYPH|nr:MULTISPECIES: LysR substrate-binding domain-containing protein [Agrobacterium]AMD58679.1 LysR family transcriptional regulator [Agrobacterium tumefaciens]EKJ93114.1 LysR family transcriptional regulator [Bradyrhizobium lupini HPC(L)]KIV66924.1 HTH-type transcriptional activator ampR [Rhizobium sp. UR51a]MBM7322861.1 LysR family transcriptional regulator [Agrobacterium sp. S2]MDP9731775.1 LysR family transcriptional regulator of beta-lactamase [Rhizobium sp. SORGH_AS_0285]MDP9752172.1 LysR 